MTFEQVQLVQQTFRRLDGLTPQAVGQLFYGRLFDIAPETQPLFRHKNLPEQSGKLMAMLTYVVERLHQPDSLVADVSALARRHQRYGVENRHYYSVGQALLWTLEQGLGPHWNPEVGRAWADCYRLLSQTMIDAANPAHTSPPFKYVAGYR